MNSKRNTTYTRTKRSLLLISYDIIVCVLSYGFIMLLNPSDSATISFANAIWNLLILLSCIAGMRLAFKVYNQVWRYSRSNAYMRLMIADTLALVVYLLISSGLMIAIVPFRRMTSVCSICVVMLSLLTTTAMRYAYTWLYEHAYQPNSFKIPTKIIMWILKNLAGISLDEEIDFIPERNKIRIAIIGAGRVGAMLAEDLLTNYTAKYRPVCFVDVSKEKIGREISGVKVIQETDNIKNALLALDVQEVVIAVQQTGKLQRDIFERYKKMGFKILVYTYPIGTSKENSKRQIREFKIDELLFRKEVEFLSEETKDYYRGKVVLISGGGGSIGSELARQIARMDPQQLILLDIYENNVYDVQQQLQLVYHDQLNLCVEIASVRDAKQLDKVFRTYHPDVVLHAAAHKHVPLMEHNCSEAVKNNVFGTWNMVNVSEKYKVKKFIMVSTDKAVNPTNVMGASKRLCEMIVLSRAAEQKETSFSCTRFGNVLGSNGSVIPLFERQIANGGPITLTDRRIIRYFMTIPEASQLVLTSGAMAATGELFVLDMGKPVKILDLAENMIRLSGYEPYKDIDIVEVGLRPGEKLFEELLIKTETLRKTENRMIFIENDVPLSRDEINDKLSVLKTALDTEDDDVIRKAMKKVVPTYHSPKHVNRDAMTDGRYNQEANGQGQEAAG